MLGKYRTSTDTLGCQAPAGRTLVARGGDCGGATKVAATTVRHEKHVFFFSPRRWRRSEAYSSRNAHAHPQQACHALLSITGTWQTRYMPVQADHLLQWSTKHQKKVRQIHPAESARAGVVDSPRSAHKQRSVTDLWPDYGHSSSWQFSNTSQ